MKIYKEVKTMKFLIYALAMFFALATFNSLALTSDDKDLGYTEHNWTVKHNKWNLSFRNQAGLEKDTYHHIDVGYVIKDTWLIRLRRSDISGTIEWRPRVLTKIYKWKNLAFVSDIEYLAHEDNTDDYIRFRPFLSYKTKIEPISEKLIFEAKLAPRFEVGNDKTKNGYADTRLDFFLTYRHSDTLAVGAFVRNEINEGVADNAHWVGTNLTLNF